MQIEDPNDENARLFPPDPAVNNPMDVENPENEEEGRTDHRNDPFRSEIEANVTDRQSQENRVYPKRARRVRVMLKSTLYEQLRIAHFLPPSKSKACSKNYLARLMNESSSYGALAPVVAVRKNPQKRHPLGLLHKVACTLFYNKTTKLLFHLEQTACIEYYLTLIPNLDKRGFEKLLVDSDYNALARALEKEQEKALNIRITPRIVSDGPRDRFRLGLVVHDPESGARAYGRRAEKRLKVKLANQRLYPSGNGNTHLKRIESMIERQLASEERNKILIDGLKLEFTQKLGEVYTRLEALIVNKNDEICQNFREMDANFRVKINQKHTLGSYLLDQGIDQVSINNVEQIFEQPMQLKTHFEENLRTYLQSIGVSEEIIKIDQIEDKREYVKSILVSAYKKIVLKDENIDLGNNTMPALLEMAKQVIERISSLTSNLLTKRLYSLHWGALHYNNKIEEFDFIISQMKILLNLGPESIVRDRTPHDLLLSAHFSCLVYDNYFKFIQNQLYEDICADLSSGNTKIDNLAKFIYNINGYKAIGRIYGFLRFPTISQESCNLFVNCLPRPDSLDLNYKPIVAALKASVKELDTIPEQVQETIGKQADDTDLLFICMLLRKSKKGGLLNIISNRGLNKKKAEEWIAIIGGYKGLAESTKIVLSELVPCTPTRRFFKTTSPDKGKQLQLLLSLLLSCYYLKETADGLQGLMFAMILRLLTKTPYSPRLYACSSDLNTYINVTLFHKKDVYPDLFEYIRKIRDSWVDAPPHHKSPKNANNIILDRVTNHFKFRYRVFSVILESASSYDNAVRYYEAVKNAQNDLLLETKKNLLVSTLSQLATTPIVISAPANPSNNNTNNQKISSRRSDRFNAKTTVAKKTVAKPDAAENTEAERQVGVNPQQAPVNPATTTNPDPDPDAQNSNSSFLARGLSKGLSAFGWLRKSEK